MALRKLCKGEEGREGGRGRRKKGQLCAFLIRIAQHARSPELEMMQLFSGYTFIWRQRRIGGEQKEEEGGGVRVWTWSPPRRVTESPRGPRPRLNTQTAGLCRLFFVRTVQSGGRGGGRDLFTLRYTGYGRSQGVVTRRCFKCTKGPVRTKTSQTRGIWSQAALASRHRDRYNYIVWGLLLQTDIV